MRLGRNNKLNNDTLNRIVLERTNSYRVANTLREMHKNNARLIASTVNGSMVLTAFGRKPTWNYRRLRKVF